MTMTQIKKPISIILALCFLFTLVPAESVYAKHPPIYLSSVPAVPEEWASVKRFSPSKASMGRIYLLEDAHGYIEAQERVLDLLSFLEEKTQVELVGVEGSSEDFNLLLFRSFPNLEKKKSWVRNKVREGELSGADGAAILSNQPMKYFGIEDEQLYQKNLNRYFDVQQQKPNKQIEAFEEKLDKQLSSKLSTTLLEVLNLEERLLHQDQAPYEWMKQLCSYQEILQAPKKLSHIFSLIKRTENDENFHEPLPKLEPEIFLEIKDYFTELKQKLIRSEDEANLLKRRDQFLRLKQLRDLKLTRQEWENLNKDFDELREFFEIQRSYYQTAIKRERSFVKSALNQMESTKQKETILHVGGFHTQGLKEAFLNKNYEVVQITPKWKKERESTYQERMNLIASSKSSLKEPSLVGANLLRGRVEGDVLQDWLSHNNAVEWGVQLIFSAYRLRQHKEKKLFDLLDRLTNHLDSTTPRHEGVASAKNGGSVLKGTEKLMTNGYELTASLSEDEKVVGASLGVKFSEKKILIGRIRTGFRQIEEGRVERVEIGDVSLIVQKKTGRSNHSFPTPDGDRVRKSVNFIAYENLDVIELTIVKGVEGQITLEFSHQKKGEEPKVSKVLWNGKEYERVLNNKEKEKQALIKKIRKAYQQIKSGAAEVGVGDIEPLVNLKFGWLYRTFPTPDGGALKDKKPGFNGRNIKSMDLKLIAAENGEIIFELSYVTKLGETEKTIMYWKENSLLSEKDYHLNKIMNGFKDLKAGNERVLVGGIDFFVRKKQGVLSHLFPSPDGEPLGEGTSIRSGPDIKTLTLSLLKDKANQIFLELHYTKENDEEGVSTLVWHNGKYVLPIKLLDQKFRQGFSDIEAGGSKFDIGEVSPFFNKDYGVSRHTFPTPKGTVKRNSLVRLEKNLDRVELKLLKVDDGSLVLEFEYELKGGAKGSKKVFWNGSKYEADVEKAVRKVKEAYKKVYAGEQKVVIGDASLLVSKERAHLYRVFPMPDGNPRRGSRNIGMQLNVQEIALTVHRGENGHPTLEFLYKKDEEEKILKIYWNGTLFETEKERLINKIRAGFEQVKTQGQEVSIGDVSLLVSKTSGGLQKTFPTPDGGQIDKPKRFGISEDLELIELTIEKDAQSQNILLRFDARKVGETRWSKPVVLVWDGTKFTTDRTKNEVNKELVVQKIKNAFLELQKEKKSIDIGNVTQLVGSKVGYLYNIFPTPDGNKVGKPTTVGLGVNIESISLKIEKDEELVLIFTVKGKNKETKAVRVYWNGKNYEKEYSRFLRKVREGFRLISKSGTTVVELGDVSRIVNTQGGTVYKTFPTPDGATIGKNFSLGTGGKVQGIALTLRKEIKTGRILLEFNYTKIKTKNVLRTQTLYWNPKIKTYLPYVKETQQEVYEFNLEDEFDGASLGDQFDQKKFVIERIQKAYKQIADGKQKVDVGDVSALIDLKKGLFIPRFPAPDGSKKHGAQAVGIGHHVKRVLLTLLKENETLVFKFTYLKEGSSQYQETKLYWNGTNFLLTPKWTRVKIYNAFDAIKPGETISIGDVSSVTNKERGCLLKTFPLPNGGRLGKNQTILSQKNNDVISLKVIKETEELILEFSYSSKNDNKVRRTRIYWNGSAYELEQDWKIRRIKEAYKKLKEGEVKDIGDVSSVINIERGLFQSAFPTPDGRRIKKVYTAAIGADSKQVWMRVRKENGDLTLELDYVKEKEKGTQILYWNGKKFETDFERKIRNIQEGFQRVLEDKTSVFSVLNIDFLVNQKYGYFLRRFPTPNGRQIGNAKLPGFGLNVRNIQLDVIKEDSEMVLSFNYDKEGKDTKSTLKLYWDGHKYLSEEEKKGENNSKEVLIRKIRKGYEVLQKDEKQSIEIGDISLLVSMQRGKFRSFFPTPEGGKLKTMASLYTGVRLESLTLNLKREGEDIVLELSFKRQGDTSLKNIQLYWNGTEFEQFKGKRSKMNEKQDLLKRIADGLKKVRKQEEDTVDIGDVSSVMNMKFGMIAMVFPAPNGGKVGFQKTLGMGKVEVITLEITRESEELVLLFKYEGKNKNGMAKLYWTGQEYVTGQQRQMEFVRTSYEKLERGDEVRIQIEEHEFLINKRHGFLQGSFPTPDGKEIGEMLFPSMGENVEYLDFFLIKEESTILLEFHSRQKGKKETIISRLYWNGTEFESDKDIEVGKIKEGFEFLSRGIQQRFNVGPLNELISKGYGKLQADFPTPDGNKVGRVKPMSLGPNFKEISLEILLEEGQIVLFFTYTGEGEKEQRQGKMYWVHDKYLTEKEMQKHRLAEAVKAVYNGSLDQYEVEDVVLYVNKSVGRLNRSFPTPEDGVVGKMKTIGIGKPNAEVKFTVKRDVKTQKLQLVFKYRKEGEVGFREGPVILTWNGTEYETPKEIELRLIREGFQTIQNGNLKSVRVGELNELVSKEYGKLQGDFPTPDGNKIKRIKSLRMGPKHSYIALEITKEEGGIVLIFDYILHGTAEIKKGKLYWIDGTYLTEKEFQKHRLIKAIDDVNNGALSFAEITKLDYFLNFNYGVLNETFPTPIGTKIGKQQSLGIGGLLESVKLIVEKEIRTQRLLLKFIYKRKGEADYHPEPVILFWNKKTNKYEKYVREVQQDVYEFDPNEEFEGMSLGTRLERYPKPIQEALRLVNFLDRENINLDFLGQYVKQIRTTVADPSVYQIMDVVTFKDRIRDEESLLKMVRMIEDGGKIEVAYSEEEREEVRGFLKKGGLLHGSFKHYFRDVFVPYSELGKSNLSNLIKVVLVDEKNMGRLNQLEEDFFKVGYESRWLDYIPGMTSMLSNISIEAARMKREGVPDQLAQYVQSFYETGTSFSLQGGVLFLDVVEMLKTSIVRDRMIARAA